MNSNYIEKKEPYRVLQVIGRMDRGGAEAMVMNLYRKMNREKIQFDFLVHTQEKRAYDEEIRRLGGNIYYLPRFRGVNLINYCHACNNFFDEHSEICIVHGHIGSSAALYLQVAKKHGIYTIAHSHSADTHLINMNTLSYKLFSYPTRFVADYFFGCSTEAGLSRYGKKIVQSQCYSNFYNAIDTTLFRFNPAKREMMRSNLGIRERDFVVGTVGRVTLQKNPKFLFNLFEHLVGICPEIKCLWVGTGELEEEYRNKISSVGLQNRIVMTGVRSDVADVMQAFDCFVLPSAWEGLPVVGIEAQASGLPCLFSEEISRETQVTDLVTWEPINQGNSVWIEQIMKIKQKNNIRISPIEEIKKAGYDVNDSVKRLSQFYLKHVKDN